MTHYLQTGQSTCHDPDGETVSCGGTGQDAEFGRGAPWPERRFELQGETVLDRLTGLVWTRDANMAEYPQNWREALNFVADMNSRKVLGFDDWRLPNRRELRSLMSHHTHRPALPGGHPFLNVFSGWYWSSTSAAINPAYAWYVHLEGARTFYGHKEQFFLAWPVRGSGNGLLPATGQTKCYDSSGKQIPCELTGQDGEYRFGAKWPEPRFEEDGEVAFDRLTGLYWRRSADLANGTVSWKDALEAIAGLNGRDTGRGWRLPNINELDSLLDCSAYGPALPAGHPFKDISDVYWSSTTSMFEPDWAWALYLTKGAVGVGRKNYARFSVWAVCDKP